AVGRMRGSAAKSSAARTSTTAGAPGTPIRRANWETVISVFDGTGRPLPRSGNMDAIFGLPPHGVVADDPRGSPYTLTARVEKASFDPLLSYLRFAQNRWMRKQASVRTSVPVA